MAWLVLGLTWLVSGIAAAVLMARRGHDATTWALLGLLLGPVAAVLAVRAVGDERTTGPRLFAPGSPRSGRVDVVAGIDGSPEAEAAVKSAVALLGDRLGRTVLVLVTPFDAVDDPDGVLAVDRVARAIDPIEPAEVELYGDPARALRRYALDEHIDLIVVGARGRGRSSAVLGSVATRLAAASPVPVFVGPAVDGP